MSSIMLLNNVSDVLPSSCEIEPSLVGVVLVGSPSGEAVGVGFECLRAAQGESYGLLSEINTARPAVANAS